MEPCPLCEKQFSTKRGLGVHIAKAHPSHSFCARCGIELNDQNRRHCGKQKRNYCKSCRNKMQREEYLRNPQPRLEQCKKYQLKRKDEITRLLGGKCVICGFSDRRALCIDHINNDGYKEKRKFGSYGTSAYLNHVIEEIKSHTGRYQLLCANCNIIKEKERLERKYNGKFRVVNP